MRTRSRKWQQADWAERQDSEEHQTGDDFPCYSPLVFKTAWHMDLTPQVWTDGASGALCAWPEEREQGCQRLETVRGNPPLRLFSFILLSCRSPRRSHEKAAEGSGLGSHLKLKGRATLLSASRWSYEQACCFRSVQTQMPFPAGK